MYMMVKEYQNMKVYLTLKEIEMLILPHSEYYLYLVTEDGNNYHNY